jgi:alkanesulfonate monooxygenase SsuD/methylene tetrahydromethanopterin reductase-like flavin-dependent oxidoreductase (luciferase family)
VRILFTDIEVFLDPLRQGARRGGRALEELDLVAAVALEIHDDQASADDAARRHADGYAFTIGAMGVDGRNFYNDAFSRVGYGAEVATVTHLWQAGKRNEARAAVPIELGRLTNLVGTAEWIGERVGTYRQIGITTLLAKLEGNYDDQLTALRRLTDIIAATAETQATQ